MRDDSKCATCLARRAFVAAAGVGALTLALPGCEAPTTSGRISEGPIDSTNGGTGGNMGGGSGSAGGGPAGGGGSAGGGEAGGGGSAGGGTAGGGGEAGGGGTAGGGGSAGGGGTAGGGGSAGGGGTAGGGGSAGGGGTAPTCTAGKLAAGAASSYTVGMAKVFSNAVKVSGQEYDIMVAKDANGFYAMDSDCTHSGCSVDTQGTGYYCNCHGATFDSNGKHTGGPGSGYLQHYAVCVDASGNVTVDTSTQATPTQRY